jgi:hypothetical protein
MKLPIQPIFLLTTLAAAGCAGQQSYVLPGEDRNQLAKEIITRGQCEGPQESQSSGSTVLGDVLKTGAKVGKTCAVISEALVYCVAGGHTHGEVPQEDQSGNSVSGALSHIWCED